eukprot:CAMPEP_0182455610 /NCGR_PEP_ID=MMETSP1319-20130603/1724_1 /TAXON_ID=172717 /ORGANISM="Bolidomonas pacifica, Strain RCC208" /LENGTH=159 /DNA_ID=CAMNT_0024653713 /DNA_START=274 /DNA_END=749 /DNA_ORIENTATION=+
MLFSRGMNMQQKFEKITKAVGGHAKSLALHAFIYKATLYALHLVTSGTGTSLVPFSGRPLRPYHSLIAGGVGGWLVWGDFTAVNYQVTLYLLSRVLASAANSLSGRSGLGRPRGYRVASVLVWASVMYLFETDPAAMQHGLRRSMEEVYRLDERVAAGG